MNDMNVNVRADRTVPSNGSVRGRCTPRSSPRATGALQNVELAALAAAPVASQGAEPPQNAEMLKVIDDVLGALKYSFVAVAANPEVEVRPESVEGEVKRYLQGMEEAAASQVRRRREGAGLGLGGGEGRDLRSGRTPRRGRARRPQGLRAVRRRSRRRSKIDRKLLGLRPPEVTLPLDAIERIDDRLVIRRDALGGSEMPIRRLRERVEHAEEQPVSEERLAEIWGDYREADAQTDFESVRLDKLAFNVERVRCVDETNPERGLFINYHDEIAIGGQSIDEDGDVKLIPEHFVGGGFDDGDQRLYNPAWRLHWFSLNEGRSLAQGIPGRAVPGREGLGQVPGLSRQGLPDDPGTRSPPRSGRPWASAVTPFVGPALGALIGAAVAYVVDRLVKFWIELFGDDLFDPVVCRLRHGGYGGRWANGSTRSPTMTARFVGFGGHYIVNYHWQLYR